MKKYILLLFLFAFTLNTFSQTTNSESKKEENQISNVTEVGDTKTESADVVAAAKKQKRRLVKSNLPLKVLRKIKDH